MSRPPAYFCFCNECQSARRVGCCPLQANVLAPCILLMLANSPAKSFFFNLHRRKHLA
jgi:hypothetical protein